MKIQFPNSWFLAISKVYNPSWSVLITRRNDFIDFQAKIYNL